MSLNTPVANSNFREIKHLSRADDRGRLTVGAVAKKKNYRVMINELGQILLDPIVNIPEQEMWFWKNQSAQKSLKRGLEEAEAGETQDLGSFAEYADLDIND
jgi:glycine cleavage system aminomethyltransferase T